jgi:predicted Fe-Mo cluster-binding NifX family protein
MKIAVSSEGPELTSKVDPRFGRARYFIVYDTLSNGYEVIDNEINAGAAQGAGVQAAQNVVKKEVSLVISGNIGPKAFATLSAAGIKTALRSEGTVLDAVELARNDSLEVTEGANVDGHWQ